MDKNVQKDNDIAYLERQIYHYKKLIHEQQELIDIFIKRHNGVKESVEEQTANNAKIESYKQKML